MNEPLARNAKRREEDWVADGARALGPALDKALSLVQRSLGAERTPAEEETEEMPRMRAQVAGVL